MLYDNHVHSAFSADGSMSLEQITALARGKHLGVVLTDHLDLDQPNGRFEATDYAKAGAAFRSCGLLLGTECGMVPSLAHENRAFLNQSAPDFILGSVHTYCEAPTLAPSGRTPLPPELFWARYLDYVLYCLKTHPFIDSLGHLDYPARYAPYEGLCFSWTRDEKELSAIYRFLIEHEIALELNLRRFTKDNLEEFTENYGAYRSMGGRLVTLGSDAHRPEALGERLQEGFDFCRALDLLPVHYEHHRPVVEEREEHL
ncbi:Histidinol-phosphatase [Clostridiaceae bacterium JG1575]|nr:Histidinol-phosphatase [Clostridiaceae bacterium JG1575]